MRFVQIPIFENAYMEAPPAFLQRATPTWAKHVVALWFQQPLGLSVWAVDEMSGSANRRLK